MKRFFLVIVIFFLCVLNISAESIDWMPDAALREAVREALELPAGVPLTKDHMRELDIFIADRRGISDLTGLELAINLRILDLDENSIKEQQYGTTIYTR